MKKKKEKQKTNKPVLYDYWKGDKEKLTRDGKKVDIVLLPNLSKNTLTEMGDLGYLTGQAYIDYIKAKGEISDEQM